MVEGSVVLLNSGGIDSRVTAAMLHRSGMTIHSLFIDWMFSITEVGGAAAAETARLYASDHTVLPWGLDWSMRFERLGRQGFPFTGIGAIVVGGMYAATLGAEFIASGVRDEGRPSKEWPDEVQKVLAGGMFTAPMAVLLPVYHMNATQVSTTAKELGVPLETTYSCMVVPPCGTCKSCQRRKEQHLWPE